jgi:hypothetical protein
MQDETKMKIGRLELNGKQNEKQGSEHTKVLTHSLPAI